jgi:CheY-like chemotaxis protein
MSEQRKRVLVADDDKVWVELLRHKLRERGFEVVTAYDCIQTLMVAMKSDVDAIVLDVQMPGGTGEATLLRLRSSTRTGAVPVVVVSALSDEQLPERLKALGADAFLRKPVDADEVCKTLCEVLAPPGASAQA